MSVAIELIKAYHSVETSSSISIQITTPEPGAIKIIDMGVRGVNWDQKADRCLDSKSTIHTIE